MTGVRHFYDANTWKFLLTGTHRALHRELWGPGVRDRGEAVHYTHQLVLDQLGPEDRRLLDLGCGVGTAALYLAQRRRVDVVGVSISPAQIRLAERFARAERGLAGTVRFLTGDFTALPEELTGFDLAFAIESFVHAPEAAAFFREAARTLRLGGALVVVDDVRSGSEADDRIEEFRAGWHIGSLLTVEDAAGLAAQVGLDLVSVSDLSSLQRLRRPRDRLIQAAQPVLRAVAGRSPWAQSLVGGHALQQCHRAGLLEYRLLRFERRATG